MQSNRNQHRQQTEHRNEGKITEKNTAMTSTLRRRESRNLNYIMYVLIILWDAFSRRFPGYDFWRSVCRIEHNFGTLLLGLFSDSTKTKRESVS